MTMTTASLPLLACSVTPRFAPAAATSRTAGTFGAATRAASPLTPFRTLGTLALFSGFLAGPGLAAAGPAAPAAGTPAAAAGAAGAAIGAGYSAPVLHPNERHLRNLRQLTFGGENAEAYFAQDGRHLIMQSTTAQDRCDQIYSLEVPIGSAALAPLRPISQGHGRNTCSYYFPDNSRVLFASTRHNGDGCPPTPDRSKGYVWPLYNYQIYTARPDGSDAKRLISSGNYDAEATVCKDGSVVFTSDRDGDLELYRMKLDGSGLVRLTNAPGYDGGAFFSEDCKHLVWRAARPRSAEEQAEMKALLGQHLVRPTRMELWVGDADGKNAHAVTDFGMASFAPFYFPAKIAGAPNRRIIYASNYGDPRGREFDLWAINSDGSQLERITHTADFDGFPMFSPDGTRLVFASNRNGKAHGETDVFMAEWQDAKAEYTPTPADTVATRVAWLAAPEREGRGVGTKGITAAADELAGWMKAAGLMPAGAPTGKKGERSFFQPVEVFVGVRDTGSRFRSEAPGPAAAIPAAEMIAAAMSSSGKFAGGLRFAGYGVSAPEASWDDLHGVEVKGQLALVLRGVPGDKFSGAAARSYSDLRYKAWNLREHGAQAVIFVDAKADGVPKLTLDGPEGGAGIPVAFASRAQVARWLAAAAGGPAAAGAGDDPLAALVKAAEAGKAAEVALTGKLSGNISLARESRHERNVIGLLPATTPAPAGAAVPAVVLGAHYDHLGLGGRSSLAPGQSAVHPGADDNASGTVALLEAARQLAASPTRPADLYFAAFTGEELGLVGSSQFTQTLPGKNAPGAAPALSKERLRAMLNFDMVGRLAATEGGAQAGGTQPKVVVQGSDSAAEWAELVGPQCQRAGLTCKLGGDGYGPSDMTPFYAAGVPVLFFFTGAHADYHRPSDTADKINSIGIVQVAGLATGIVQSLGERLQKQPQGLTFKKPSGPAPRGGDRGYGAYLGTIPDYSAMQGAQGGVKLSGARPGSPAEQAGVQAEDVLVGLGESKIATLEDMAFALRKYKPGQNVEVVVLRKGQKQVLHATLAQRQ